jgi:hypothetical protein
MRYGELLNLYFARSNALQWYWTLYVVVIGGLLAFSSLRQRRDRITGILVTVLYVFFAYKNLGAIEDVTRERKAILDAMKTTLLASSEQAQRELIEPTLRPTDVPGVRRFHVASDVLTVAALWAMELRRRRAAEEAAAAVKSAL